MHAVRVFRQIVPVRIASYTACFMQLFHELHAVAGFSVPVYAQEPVNGVSEARDEPRRPLRIKVGEFGVEGEALEVIFTGRVATSSRQRPSPKRSQLRTHKAKPLHVIKGQVVASPVVLIGMNQLALSRGQALQFLVDFTKILPHCGPCRLSHVNEINCSCDARIFGVIYCGLHIPSDVLVRRSGHNEKGSDYDIDKVFAYHCQIIPSWHTSSEDLLTS
mmetsp:Transcript_21597/g.44334  ORF Transcript_21597/g.44334 Transcript_21597/m.44334 type:complete len:219 (-) Transcript_21597:9-665(-)